MSFLEIIPYEDHHQPAFDALNREWLELHNLMEQHDVDILTDPRGMIIDSGGCIYLARLGNEIVGSAALMREHGNVYELVKMAVAPKHRGKGISKVLLQQCIDQAHALGASKLILFSSTKLGTALALYENYGFRHVAVEDSPFETADVKMELVL